MATLKLDLSNLSVIDNKFYVINANKTSLKYAGYKAEDVSNDKVTFADGSTLDNTGKFTAASGTGTFNSEIASAAVGNDVIKALAGEAAAIAKAAVDKAEVTANKKTVAEDALKAAAEKAGKNTLAYAVYMAATTVSSALSDQGVVDTEKIDGLTEVFSSGSAALPSLVELDFSDAGAVTVDATSLQNPKKLTGSAYADKLTVGATTVDGGVVVDAGEGNDVLNIAKVDNTTVTANVSLGDGDDVLNIAKDALVSATVSLGDGKDVVNIASSTASVSISDYSYADGDKINLTYAKSDTVFADDATKLTSGAELTVGNIKATVVASDNVAAANVSGEKQTVTFFTATNNAKEVEINAKGIANETRIDATTSKLANITLGSGESNVTLATAGNADVINATGAGKVTVNAFTEKEDTLILDGANLTNIKLAAVKNSTSSKNDDAELTYGKTTVKLVNLAKTDAHTINLNDGKLAYDLVGSKTLSEADMYFGNADTKTTVQTTGSVHLTETDKYRNIYNVAVTAGTKDEDKLDLSGFTTSGTTGINIDASKSDVAVNVWAYNKNTKATDTVKLSAHQDTVSFVSDDGKVSVDSFTFGNAEDSDILYLRDTKDLQKLAVKSGEIKLGNSKATVGHAANGNDLMQVKLADGTTSLVAGNFSTVSTEASSINVTLTSTQAVDFYALTGTKNTLTVSKDATNVDDAINFKYSNFDANHTTGTLVKDITVKDFGNSDDDEVTIGAVSKVSVDGSSKTHIWVCGAAESGSVDISKSTGKDQIDFVSGIDKKVTVTGYDAAGEDTIYLRGAEDLKAVTAGYKFEYKSGGIQITGADNATSKLVLDGANKGELNLKTLNGSSLKAFVTDDAEATFSTDTKIYAGMTKLVADMSTEGDVAIRIGTKGEIGLDSSSTYYVDNKVTEFNGSNSNAVFHLAGSSTAATTLRGGNTENSFYGGGSFNDTMVGNVSAVDTFYFGKGDGKDTIQDADGKDTVCLMNVSLEEISVDTKKNVISIGANDTLTFGKGAEDALTAGELTFNIGGSNYVCKDGKFVAKEA